MSEPRVLITFYSRCGSTEKLASSAGVGAVQGRSLIRLRRVPDVENDEPPPDCQETYTRMRREYVTPAQSDVLWADAVIFGVSPGCTPASGQWTAYLELLEQLRDQGKLDGKVGGVVTPASGSDDARESRRSSWSASILKLGFVALPVPSAQTVDSIPNELHRAVIQGRRVAAVVNALKSGSATWADAQSLLPDEHTIG